MDMMPAISEAETQRRTKIREQIHRDCRTQTHKRWRQMILNVMRRTLIFLLGVAIVTAIVAHRNRIDSLATQKISGVVAQLQTKANTADPLRQSALDYEKQVEEVAGK